MPFASTGRKWSSIWYRAFTPTRSHCSPTYKTDLVIGSENKPRRGIVYHPLFSLRGARGIADRSRLRAKRFLVRVILAKETLHHLSGARRAHRPDRRVLQPAEVRPRRRTTETDRRHPAAGGQPAGRGALRTGNQDYWITDT